ncbi:MAG: hypothetical protein ACOC7L_00265 [Acidobacteriota bacterium]
MTQPAEAAPAPRSRRSRAPSHAPAVGWSRRLLGRYHVTGVFWYRFHVWGMSHLPSWAVGIFVALFTAFFFLVLRRIRRAVAANLEAVLGPCGWMERQRRIWRTLWNQAWCNSERYERLTTERRFAVRAEGLEHWDRITGAGAEECDGERSGSTSARSGRPGSGSGDDRSGPGFVLVTGHIGAWDVSSFLPAQVEPRPVHVVREQEMDPEAQRLIEELYGERTAEHFTLHFSRDNPALGAVLLAALRRGEIVGIQGDRPVSTGRAVETELFGRPFHLPAGPAALAGAAGAPLVPVFCFREGRRRYRLVVRPPIDPSPTGDPEVDRDEALRRTAREIEWAIREEPHQWFCFRRLWKDQR